MVDNEGKYTYSIIRSVNNASSFSVTLYPNPVKNNLVLNFNSKKIMDMQIEIVSMDRR